MIVCLGTTAAVQRTMIFPKLTIDSVNRATQVVESAAGKSVNVARVLTVLGEPAVATGFLGGDRGDLVRQELDAALVPHDFVSVKAQTRMCITVIDLAADVHTELVEEAKAVEEEAWQALRGKLDALVKKARMIVMSGTMVPNAPPDFYGEWTAAANKAGIPAIVDAAGEALLRSLPARPLLAKPNRSELAKTLGVDLSTESAVKEGMRKLVDLGAQTALITLGADGALAFDGQQFWRVHPPKVKVVNSIGSGDAFTAGLASSLLKGQSLPEACRLAGACGAANAMTLRSGEVYLKDVQPLVEKVKVEAC